MNWRCLSSLLFGTKKPARRHRKRPCQAAAVEALEIRKLLTADLRAEVADAPNIAYKGYAVPVTTQVVNDGNTASGGFYVRYFASLDTTIGTGDTLLKTVYRPSVAAGGRSDWTESVTLPANLAAGEWHIGYQVDPFNFVRESDETNNALVAATTTVSIPPPVDLRAASVGIPYLAMGGKTYNVATIVANQGTGASGAFQISYYLTTDGTIDDSDVLLKSVAATSIAARSQRWWYESITLPFETATGNYRIAIVVDPLDSILEPLENNNTFVTSAFRITAPPKIDLQAIIENAPAEVLPGQNAFIQTRVSNSEASPSGTYKLNYYLSTDDTISTSDFLLKSVTRASLAGGASQTWTEQIALPANLASGTYRLGVIVDPANAILETVEGNNVGGTGLPFVVRIPDKAGQFNIAFNFRGLTESQQEIFRQAADRWSEIIVGDIPDQTYYGVFIDDVQINVSAKAIDGAGKVLGQSGPQRFRYGTSLPLISVMEFDTADLAAMERAGTLYDVMIHEIAHALGLGSIWKQKGLLTGAGGAAPLFTGKQAVAAYNEIFGTNATGVPVEGNKSPVGSRDSHWSEAVFTNEVSTPYLTGSVRPISRVSVASMADIGYRVNLDAADFYLPAGIAGSVAGGTGSGSGKAGLQQGTDARSSAWLAAPAGFGPATHAFDLTWTHPILNGTATSLVNNALDTVKSVATAPVPKDVVQTIVDVLDAQRLRNSQAPWGSDALTSGFAGADVWTGGLATTDAEAL
ncbi:MAG: hypothetical protein IT428_01480 [Planctomycetaceae bacterium]|nr:hypothetical protein [Planctomycetaceae bacterium]